MLHSVCTGKLAEAKRYQLEATEVLAELLKSDNVQFTAQKYLDSLTEEFFMIASTYLEMVHRVHSLILLHGYLCRFKHV